MPQVIKVYGPPGTGKTTHLIGRVETELANGVLPNEIIYTSFTRSAAYEARDRALVRFQTYVKSDFLWFSTIHSICFRLLNLHRDDIFTGSRVKEFCAAYGYQLSSENKEHDAESDSDIPFMVLSTTADYFEHFISWMRNTRIQFDKALDKFMNQPGIPNEFSEPDVRLYIQRRNDYKAQKNLYDFTDLIEMSLLNGLCPPNTKVMISDEMQDLSPLLVRLLNDWGKKMERVYQAGDPYQAVYTFMGADPSIFIKAPSDSSVVLHQSYRCSAPIHDVSRKLVERFSTRYTDDDFLPTNQQGFVTRQVPEAIDWENIKGTVFYLHRTNWLISQAFTQLVDDGVPFTTLHGRRSPLQTSRARVVNSIMRLADNKDIPIADVLKMIDLVPTKNDRGTLLKHGAKTEIKQAAHDNTGVTIRLSDLPDLGFMPVFMKHMKPETAIHVLKLENEERGYFTKLIRRFGYGVLNAEPKITLATIHGVKGREADTVILNTNLTHRTFDSYINDPEPEHRLYYVGVTRAKTRLMLIEPDDFEAYRI